MIAITSRCDFERAQEGSPHQFNAPESARESDLLQALFRLLELLPGGFETYLLDITGRSYPQLAYENAREVAGAHGGAGSQGFYGKVPVQILFYPDLEFEEGFHA